MNPPAEPDEDVRRALNALEVRTSARHDDAVMQAARQLAAEPVARETASSIAPVRRRTWSVLLSAAAGFVVGMATLWLIVIGPTSTGGQQHADAGTLVVPYAVRGASSAPVPVEKVPAEQWHRYIQELLVAGEMAEAEQHLRRFNELHPDYVAPP